MARAKLNYRKTAWASPNLLSSWGKKLHASEKLFYRGVGKNRVVQYIPPGGEKHKEGGGKDYERRPVQLGVSLLSLSPGDTPAS
jgi:hypothetical protein